MAVVERFGQGVTDAGTHANHRVLLDAERGRNAVGGEEPDAANVARQPVGIVADEASASTP